MLFESVQDKVSSVLYLLLPAAEHLSKSKIQHLAVNSHFFSRGISPIESFFFFDHTNNGLGGSERIKKNQNQDQIFVYADCCYCWSITHPHSLVNWELF